MSGKRVNVLVYAGNGTTVESVRHATWSLRRLLGPNYAVVTITGDQILKEPWMPSCAMLVMPGGADMGYCRTLNGAGNRLIKQYVQMGGKYLGLCAGGYYGSARCEFEVGNRAMEVVGERELAFFPGVCRGLAFPGFQYHSEAGTRAAQLKIHQDNLEGLDIAGLRAYYNGGGVFVDAEKHGDKVEVLASYTEILAVDSGQEQAAVVWCKVGEGAAILTGPHPEFSGVNLSVSQSTAPEDYDKIVQALVADEELRVKFMKACLRKLGLTTNEETHEVPSLSKLHLTAAKPSDVASLLQTWSDVGVIAKEGEREVIKGENDRFIVEEQGPKRWDLSSLIDTVKAMVPETLTPQEHIIDYNALPKTMVIHDHDLPEGKETSHFNHQAFFSVLKEYHRRAKNVDEAFGSFLLYGEVVTSTSTMLEKNPTWLSHIPAGLTATATTQVAGRGRGSNVWVSPAGSLMFSTVLRHSMALSNTAPVVFVQYLAALAIVAGVREYDRMYEKLPIKLKWPNDIYALDPTAASGESKYVKIGGILVNSSYAGGDYTLVCGIGLNVNNTAPTTSISMLAWKAGLPSMTLERLLGSILAQFEAIYSRFCRTGFDEQFAQQYYSSWLHTDQIVTLETENGARAKIKGITRDWGLLVAEELGWEDRPTGRTFQLQSDSNSFDFFKGLLKRKI